MFCNERAQVEARTYGGVQCTGLGNETEASCEKLFNNRVLIAFVFAMAEFVFTYHAPVPLKRALLWNAILFGAITAIRPPYDSGGVLALGGYVGKYLIHVAAWVALFGHVSPAIWTVPEASRARAPWASGVAKPKAAKASSGIFSDDEGAAPSRSTRSKKGARRAASKKQAPPPPDSSTDEDDHLVALELAQADIPKELRFDSPGRHASISVSGRRTRRPRKVDPAFV